MTRLLASEIRRLAGRRLVFWLLLISLALVVLLDVLVTVYSDPDSVDNDLVAHDPAVADAGRGRRARPAARQRDRHDLGADLPPGHRHRRERGRGGVPRRDRDHRPDVGTAAHPAARRPARRGGGGRDRLLPGRPSRVHRRMGTGRRATGLGRGADADFWRELAAVVGRGGGARRRARGDQWCPRRHRQEHRGRDGGLVRVPDRDRGDPPRAR